MMHNTHKNVKKDRFAWSEELHRKFVDAVNLVGGVDKATPKKIMTFMMDETLSKEHVASHLQKYRLRLKKISNAFVPNQEDSLQFHDTNVATAVQNASLTPLNDVFDPNLTNSNFNGRWDFIFNEMYHENPVMELKEENSSLVEEYQGYFDNQQHMSQSTCMANNLGVVQGLVTSSSSCSSLELPAIAELKHEIAAARHENHQLREIVQAIKAQQDMLIHAILEIKNVPPNTQQ